MRKILLVLAVVFMGWTFESRAAGCYNGPSDIKARNLTHNADDVERPVLRYLLSSTVMLPRPIYKDFIRRIKIAAPQFMSSSSSGPSFSIPFNLNPDAIKASACTDPTKKLILTYFHDVPGQYFSCQAEYRIENETIGLNSFECTGGVPHSVSAGNWVSITVE